MAEGVRLWFWFCVYGALTVHSQWPDQWVDQAQLLKLWSDYKNGKPPGTPIPVDPSLHEHEQRSASMPLRVPPAPLGSLPSGPVFQVLRGSIPVSLPFGSALAGRHLRLNFPNRSTFPEFLLMLTFSIG